MIAHHDFVCCTHELEFCKDVGTIEVVTLRYVTLRYVTLRYVTLRYVTLRYVTLRYVTLRYVTLRYKCYRYWMLPNVYLCVYVIKSSDPAATIYKFDGFLYSGSLLTRSVADLVKKEDFVQDSEYLTTLLVVVPR